jgi:hypothetical protein
MNATDFPTDEIAKKMKNTYKDWAENPENHQDGYRFEESFAQMWQELGQQVFQDSAGEVPTDKNRKKKSTPDSAKSSSTKSTC